MARQQRHYGQAAVLSAALATTVLSTGCGGGSRGPSDSAVTGQLGARCAPESLTTQLTSTLVAIHARNRVPGISAAIFVPTVMAAPIAVAVGASALGGGHPLTAADRFLAGSVGKTFFAALALRRSAEGRFSLDAPLATLIAGARIPAFAWITPRMLLTHQSGVGEYDGPFMTALVRDPLRIRQPEDWLGVIRRNPPRRDAAGTFRYSDLNYVLLAMALDAREPGGVYQAIELAYLRPLALTGTTPSTTPRIAGLVGGYEGPASMFGRDAMLEGDTLIYNPQFEWGGGGFASTPRDLARWMVAFRRGEAFPDSLWPAVVARPAGLADSARHWRGMGIQVDSGALGTTFGHSGSMPGYVSWMRWFEPTGISVAIQANATDSVRLPEDGFDWADSIAVAVAARCQLPL